MYLLSMEFVIHSVGRSMNLFLRSMVIIEDDLPANMGPMYSSRLIDTAYLEIRWGVSSVVPRPVEPKLPLAVMVLLTSRTEPSLSAHSRR